MNRKLFSHLYRGLLFLALFILWTAAVQLLDVQSIGPQNSAVGLASLNGAFHRLVWVHMNLYLLTDWLSLIPVFIMLCFAVMGLMQWIGRRHILKADADILLLGVFYIVVLAAYLLFEQFPVNYRPVLIDGFLEASYPSSTTLLILTCMPTAVIQVYRRIGNITVRKILGGVMTAFAFLMVLGRLISGVHWLTDIIGGILLSISLTEMYVFAVSKLSQTTRHP